MESSTARLESPQVQETPGLKRKRSPINDEPSAVRQGHPPPPAGMVTPINYLVRARPQKLGLIEGDAETFGDVLEMIDSYEAALEQSIGWHDIVTYARASPQEFKLGEYSPGVMSCRIWVKGVEVEIYEDDFRVIMSGAPERVIPTQPIPEDELAELATLNILEGRLAILIKKADAVASKARQLNYHLKGRKTGVISRKAAEQQPQVMPEPLQENRPFSPQPYPNMTPRPPVFTNGDSTKIQQRLLEQYLSTTHSQPRPKPLRGTTETTNTQPIFIPTTESRRLSHPLTSSDDGIEGQYRLLMAAKMEKLARGDPIYPPCDRCRRLGFDCTKNLTACSACTKKHAKCAWKEIREGELGQVATGRAENGFVVVENGDPGLRVGEERRFEGLGGDHATLAKIASAAAAAGSR
ncbi:hypothetical protein M7I_3007 [Glarea lozoyensis 74030]|uniref:Zn(2)-C6 fungal-type domain-containing protein n=1 Tax=Glarea lozoyensis (strain ATCC 74030 / MF5533) TaxID=1104152 RepID=H0EKB2_GLAL7|nr:hypothetical protein M7I_3007 [Glarea lozoyensis 74030]